MDLLGWLGGREAEEDEKWSAWTGEPDGVED
jgi:hypothetical protein